MDRGPGNRAPFPFLGVIVMKVAMRPYIKIAAAAAMSGVFSASLAAQDTATVKKDTTANQLAVGDSSKQTHTVVKGDNLWTLAQTYLGNPFLWPELYRLNRDVVEDPHWIYPGEVIRLRAAEVTVAVAPTPRDTTQVESNPVKPAVDSAVAVVDKPVVQAPPVPMAPVSDELPTSQFQKVTPPANPVTDAPITLTGDMPMLAAPTVRLGEAMVAPFVEREGGPRGYGTIVKSGDIAGIAQASDRARFQAFDRVFIEPPAGNIGAEGERFLSYRLGPIIEGLGQIMVPTGVIEVKNAPRQGAPATAKVMKVFTEISVSDRLIPLDTAGFGMTTRPRRVTDGTETKIMWVFGEPVLASVQNYVVIDATAKNGVRVGDEYMIYKPRPKSSESQSKDPPVPVAKLQVVKVTPYGVTGIIVGQEQPQIREGMPVKVIARMP